MPSPLVGPTTARLRGLDGVTVRPFEDGRGALVLGPGGAFVVEVDDAGARITDAIADQPNRIDLALGRGPIRSACLPSAEDLDSLVHSVEAVGTVDEGIDLEGGRATEFLIRSSTGWMSHRC